MTGGVIDIMSGLPPDPVAGRPGYYVVNVFDKGFYTFGRQPPNQTSLLDLLRNIRQGQATETIDWLLPTGNQQEVLDRFLLPVPGLVLNPLPGKRMHSRAANTSRVCTDIRSPNEQTFGRFEDFGMR